MTRIKSGLVARNCITTCGLGVGGSGGFGAIAGGSCAFCGAALIGIGAFCMLASLYAESKGSENGVGEIGSIGGVLRPSP